MIRAGAVMKLLTTVLLATAFAQKSDRPPMTDAGKIADALTCSWSYPGNVRENS